ncbi:MAG: glycoside hydrolase family 3 protein [Lachnospiraceae bacterium]|nr:glycoside hydrolase family 3 protein [Lachnospiraceae bacterium]
MYDKIKYGYVLFIMILLFVLAVCVFVRGDKTHAVESVVDESLIENQAEEMLASMTVEQKVCQMFVVTPEALTNGAVVTTVDETLGTCLKKWPVGGLVYFSKNLTDAEQTKELLRCTQELALEVEGLPLLQCVDEEGGKVARIGNNKGFNVPKIGPMGKVDSEEDAYAAGSTIGIYLSDLGFTLDFAPDADVLTNQKNAVIGNRSFGGDAATVLSYAKAYSDGLHVNGILSTFKHFPGHGATEADTHEGFAYTDKTYEELQQAELVPFAGAGEAGIDCVMVSHIAVPGVTGDNTPSSLSYRMITEILRRDLKYDGIIVTDAMNMGAIVEQYASDEAAVAAVKAGADVILMPEDFRLAAEGVLAAVQGGGISEDRIDESVRRIIMVKLKRLQ